MTITKDVQGSTLNITVAGRLDTTTAPELEEVLNNSLEGVENLKFDFKELDYISSAGLRVLLSTQKTMNKQGTMTVSSVNAVVMEIFEVTGFSEILNIE